MKDWFNERYTKETPIEEQIRGRVRAECHYMDKADIYEWITQNEIKIMNLQSKIDKAIEILGQYKHLSSPTEEQAEEQEEIVSNAYDILKEEI